MSRRQRLVNLAIAGVIAVVAVVVILATSGGSDSGSETSAAPTPTPSKPAAEAEAEPKSTPRPKPKPPAIEVRDGEVVGGVATLRFSEGERVRFSVTADVADEVHVHAYDFHKDIEPGRTVRFNFPATITGITEIELEAAGLQIASLRVDP